MIEIMTAMYTKYADATNIKKIRSTRIVLKNALIRAINSPWEFRW